VPSARINEWENTTSDAATNLMKSKLLPPRWGKLGTLLRSFVILPMGPEARSYFDELLG